MEYLGFSSESVGDVPTFSSTMFYSLSAIAKAMGEAGLEHDDYERVRMILEREDEEIDE